MTFFCKDCKNEFDIDDKECEGYYNWKCPACSHISTKKDMSLGVGIIWNCDTSGITAKTYKPKETSCPESKGAPCASCPKAN